MKVALWMLAAALAVPAAGQLPLSATATDIAFMYDVILSQMGAPGSIPADVLERCVLNQTLAQADVSTLKPLDFRYVFDQYNNKTTRERTYRLSPGSLTASGNFLGDMHLCNKAEGKFCYSVPVVPFPFPKAPTTCVPAACTEDDLVLVYTMAANLTGLQFALVPGQIVNPAGLFNPQCELDMSPDATSYDEDSDAQAWAAFLISLVSVVVVATVLCRVLELVAWQRGGESTVAAVLPAAAAEFLRCWDASESLDKLLHLSPPGRGTNFLNGMRVLSICWVLLGHVPVFALQNLPGLADDVGTWMDMKKFKSLFITSALYAVDTFFFMSGFLACYLFLGKKARRAWPESFRAVPTAKNLLLTWLGRYMRLTPLYAVCLYSNFYLFEYIVEGPYSLFFKDGGPLGGEACRKYGYLNLLYVQNLFPHDGVDEKMNCFGHSWYLANDMQFLIFGSMLMAGYVYRPQISLALTALAGVISLSLDIAFMSDTHDTYNMGMWNYNKPYIRAPPYLYGMVCGYVLAMHGDRVKELVARPLLRAAVYLACAVLLFGPITLCWGAFRQQVEGNTWTLSQARAYQFAYHFCWGLGLLLLAGVWTNGHGGMVNRFLSCPLFEPLGRLTFGVYLIHPMVQEIITEATQGPAAEWSAAWLLTVWIASIAGAYIAAFIAFLAVERPFAGLYVWALKACVGGFRAAPERGDGEALVTPSDSVPRYDDAPSAPASKAKMAAEEY